MERILDPAGLETIWTGSTGLPPLRSREATDQDEMRALLSRPRLLRNEDDLGYPCALLRNTF